VITGWKILETSTSGGASSRAARSGTENARFFGTISPITTCRKVMTGRNVDERD
jgi:hypothetical protein